MEYQSFHHSKPPMINRSLLSPKLFTLLLSTGEATLLPFLPMYFRFIGLTAFQNGILGCMRPLVSFWASPLLRIFAERTKKRKCLLLALLLAAVIFNVSLGLTTSGPKADFRAYICTHGGSTSFNSTSDLQNLTKISYSNDRTNRSYLDLIATTKNPRNTSFTGVLSLSNSIIANLSSLTNIKLESMNAGMGTNRSKSLDPGLRFRPVNGTQNVKNSSNADALHNSKETEQGVEENWYLVYGFKLDHAFKVLLTLVFFCEFFASSVRGISRSIFTDISLQNRGSHLGNSLWTSLGTILGGGIIIVALGYHHCDFGLKNSFYLHFYIFAFFGTATFVLGMLLKDYEQKSFLNLRFGRTFMFLCCDIHVLCFLAVLLVLGMAESLMYNYMMWYLQDIGASIIVMGLIIVASAFSEIPMLCVSKHLTRCFGHHWVIFVSLFSYGGRFLYFSYFRNPWLIIPIELLHGLSYTTVHSACASYASSVSAHGTEKTVKVIFSSVYYGFGMGLGGIAVSLLYQLYGPVVVFRCAAGVCAAYAVVFAMLQCILVLPDGDRSGGRMMEYQQINLGGEKFDFPHQADWLMEALQAEEDGEDETHFMR